MKATLVDLLGEQIAPLQQLLFLLFAVKLDGGLVWVSFKLESIRLSQLRLVGSRVRLSQQRELHLELQLDAMEGAGGLGALRVGRGLLHINAIADQRQSHWLGFLPVSEHNGAEGGFLSGRSRYFQKGRELTLHFPLSKNIIWRNGFSVINIIAVRAGLSRDYITFCCGGLFFKMGFRISSKSGIYAKISRGRIAGKEGLREWKKDTGR